MDSKFVSDLLANFIITVPSVGIVIALLKAWMNRVMYDIEKLRIEKVSKETWQVIVDEFRQDRIATRELIKNLSEKIDGLPKKFCEESRGEKEVV